MRTTLLPITVLALITTVALAPADELPLNQINLPPGFTISVYAEGMPEARSMALSPGGTLFVGSGRQGEGRVYAVQDTDGDHRGDQVYTLAEGLNWPNGVAFHEGDLYVAEISRILRYDDIEQHLDAPPEPVVIKDDLPDDTWHGWKYIAFGPDGKLYVPVGAPCNVCEREAPYASILRMNPDGSDVETYAHGVRNTVGFTWHPETGDLWFTDNGRDNLGDNLPPCELNRAPEAGMHFGFPYLHGGVIPDPEFGEGHDPADYTAPALNLGPHVAPLGPAFYTGDAFPADTYKNQLFIAEHGSWNRTSKIGYRVALVTLHHSQPVTYTTFADGWLQGQENWGRPVDVKQTADGALLVSDDQNGVIYRIGYE